MRLMMRVLGIMFLCMGTTGWAQLTPFTISQSAKDDLLKSRELLVKILNENIVSFWYPSTIDQGNGGYALNHDVTGKYLGRANKTLVTQSRSVWFFSRLARSSFGNAEHLAAAAQGYQFMMDKLRDAQFGGFYWEVDASGSVLIKPDKHLYGQSFALYAMSEYARASELESVKLQTKKFFDHLDYIAHDDVYGGYIEWFRRDWLAPPGSVPNYMGVPANFKLMNTHLHLMEAFTAYYLATKDPVARERLIELIQIESNTVVRKALGACTDKYQQNWVPVRGTTYDRISYGHDLENIWLLRQAVDSIGMTNGPLLDLYARLFAYSMQYGHDSANGGFYDSGPFNAKADARKKVWWVQAEALVSALTMYQLTGEEEYLKTYLKTLDWINTKQVDWDNGDWHNTIEEDGKPTGDKAGPWKSPYHNGRAMIECVEIIDQLLNLE